MKLVQKQLQVRHYAQVPCKPFCVNVENEIEAKKVSDLLADQHIFLFENKIIPDYANIISVVMFDTDENSWIDYWNDEEEMDWEEFEEHYLEIPTKTF